MKWDSLSCGCVMAPGHLKLHRLSFEFDNSSWLLGEANGWEQLDNVSQSSQHTLFLHRDSSPKPFPSAPLQCKQQAWPSLSGDFYLYQILLAIPRLCVAWWAALTLLSGTCCQRMAEYCAYPSLPNWKFKQTWFNTGVSCTVSTMLHQAASRGIFQPELIKPWFYGSSPLGKTGVTRQLYTDGKQAQR